MLSHALAAVVGAFIAVAGASKLIDMTTWRRDAAEQGIWPSVSVVLPVVELTLGAAMIVVDPHPATLGAATLLLLIFTVYLVIRVASHSSVPCACFGSRSKKPPSVRDVLRNCLLLALLFVAAAVK